MPNQDASTDPRYLKSFSPKRIAHRFTDVLVIGSGLAGMRTALEIDESHHVLVVTKDVASLSNSSWAQGGIAAVWDPSDRFESHLKDTLIAGAGLCEQPIVDLVVREAPQRVQELIDWGTTFDREHGQIDLTLEGGHSAHRILHALGDATGREIMRAVLLQAEKRSNIEVMEQLFTLDLLTDEGRCVGALAWSEKTGIVAIWAQQVMLATGGSGQLFRETTNPSVATGDGLAMAWRAGAKLQDVEFMQFHPTVLYVAGSARSLISEAVRGEGAYLRDQHGHRFMHDYDPRGELAPRDVVAKSIVKQMAKTQHPCVYLDQSHLDPEMIRTRFPGLSEVCRRVGLDLARDQIPVRPGAHYMIGGVCSDSFGQSSLPGLWTAGEAAATGLHGANRLASNSLLEALVFGARAGQQINMLLKDTPSNLKARPIDQKPRHQLGIELDLRDIRNSIASMMIRCVGIERTATSLQEGIDQIEFWSQYVLGQELLGKDGWELQNMLTLARQMARSALLRTESRGTHQRADFPATDDEHWRQHIVHQRGEVQAGLVAVAPSI